MNLPGFIRVFKCGWWSVGLVVCLVLVQLDSNLIVRLLNDFEKIFVESRRSSRLAEYVSSVVEDAKKRNPRLADLDRLAEILSPRRMTYWPYFVVEYRTG
jgi:hypothetical protein